MPSQLRVLLVLFTAFIILFLVIRKLLIPDSFGDLGHYRADALTDIADKEAVFAGRETCVACHDEINEMILTDVHAKLSCEVCHGPGMKHADSMEASDIVKKGERTDCGRCHAINPARLANVITQIDLNEHNIDFKCTECHNPHQVWELME